MIKHYEFRCARGLLVEELKIGRPKTIILTENVIAIHKMIIKYRHLALKLPLSKRI